jgi:hypothetical protein
LRARQWSFSRQPCALSRWDEELQAHGQNGEKQPLDFAALNIFGKNRFVTPTNCWQSSTIMMTAFCWPQLMPY